MIDKNIWGKMCKCGNNVYGDFDCSYNKLKILDGAPRYINGGFYCNRNQLTTLSGGPQSVGGNFKCFGNMSLMSLDGVSQEIGGEFICDKESLKAKYEEIQRARFATKQKEISVGLDKQRKR